MKKLIIVHGYRIIVGGREYLSLESHAVVEYVYKLQLENQGNINKILLAGGWDPGKTAGQKKSIAEHMYDYLISKGLSKDILIADGDDVYNTVSEIEKAVELIKKFQLKGKITPVVLRGRLVGIRWYYFFRGISVSPKFVKEWGSKDWRVELLRILLRLIDPLGKSFLAKKARRQRSEI